MSTPAAKQLLVPKPWWKSRILWVQVISIIIAVCMYLGGAGVFEGLGLSAERADQARNWVMLLIAAGNIVTINLRLLPTPPIEGTPAAAAVEENAPLPIEEG